MPCYYLLESESIIIAVVIIKIGYENIDIQFLQGDNCVDILLTSTAQNNGIIKLCKT